MSGHSKWATTKHKKAVVDARRSKVFARLIKNIEVAARMGGGDVAGNPTLYDAIQKARKTSVPLDNIERAVKRGSGAEAGGADWQTIMYEGYGPSGVAVLIECLTDNRNRAASEVRVGMTRNGGSMADPGSVAYLFSRRGVVIVPKGEGTTEDTLLGVVLVRNQRADDGEGADRQHHRKKMAGDQDRDSAADRVHAGEKTARRGGAGKGLDGGADELQDREEGAEDHGELETTGDHLEREAAAMQHDADDGENAAEDPVAGADLGQRHDQIDRQKPVADVGQ